MAVIFDSATSSFSLDGRPGAPLNAPTGKFRIDVTDDGELRITDDAGVSTSFGVDFAADIAALEASMITAQANIATNTTNIAGAVAVNATQTSDIATNASAIAGAVTVNNTQNTTLGTHTTQIATNASDIAAAVAVNNTQNTTLGTHTTQIATNASDIAAAVAVNSTQTTDIASNASAIAAAVVVNNTQNTTLGTHTTQIATNTSDIAAAVAVNVTQTSDIATLSTAIANLISGATSFNGLNYGTPTSLAAAATLTITRNYHIIDLATLTTVTVTTITRSGGNRAGDYVWFTRSGAGTVQFAGGGNITTWNRGVTTCSGNTYNENLYGTAIGFMYDPTVSKWVQVNPASLLVGIKKDKYPGLVANAGNYAVMPRGFAFGQGVLGLESPSITGSNPTVLDTINVMPNFVERSWWAIKAAAATVAAIGVAAPTIVGTPTFLATTQVPNVATQTPMINIVTAAATAGLGCTVPTTTFNVVNTAWNPEFICVFETRAAADIANVRLWVGLFTALPGNLDDQAGANLSFRFSTVAGDSNLVAIYDDGTTQTVVAMSSVPALLANTCYGVRITLYNSAATWELYDLTNGLKYTATGATSVAVGTIGYTSMGGVFQYITTAAAVKNVGFGKMMVIQG